MGLGAQRQHQPPAGLRVGEDPDDAGAPLDLLVQPLEQVRALQVLVVLARQPLERQRLADDANASCCALSLVIHFFSWDVPRNGFQIISRGRQRLGIPGHIEDGLLRRQNGLRADAERL